VIGIPGHVRIYLACGVTDMRRGFDSLAAQVQTMLMLDPHDGALYAFRGRRGDLIKILWWDGRKRQRIHAPAQGLMGFFTLGRKAVAIRLRAIRICSSSMSSGS
jgi:hypothetical protein